MQRIKASFAVGLNCPVSIELIVFLETPTISAKALCDKPFSVLVSFSLFFNINALFMKENHLKYCNFYYKPKTLPIPARKPIAQNIENARYLFFRKK